MLVPVLLPVPVPLPPVPVSLPVPEPESEPVPVPVANGVAVPVAVLLAEPVLVPVLDVVCVPVALTVVDPLPAWPSVSGARSAWAASAGAAASAPVVPGPCDDEVFELQAASRRARRYGEAVLMEVPNRKDAPKRTGAVTSRTGPVEGRMMPITRTMPAGRHERSRRSVLSASSFARIEWATRHLD